MTLADLADVLADEYGIDRDAARNRMEEIADRLPAGMYDPTTGTLADAALSHLLKVAVQGMYDPTTGTLADDGEAAIRDRRR